jgi:hypothetical protein
MTRRIPSTAAVAFLMAAMPTTIMAGASVPSSSTGVPDLSNSWAVTNYPGATLLVCPAMDGDRLDMAQDCAGGVVDATVVLVVLDYSFAPIYMYPPEDLWLEANGMCRCPAGSIADAPTDINGMTTFSGRLAAGGCSLDGSLNVLISGAPLNQDGMDIDIISPDMNCDLVVNIGDFATLAGAYSGTYSKCADLVCDGVLNVSDVAAFASHYLHDCP